MRKSVTEAHLSEVRQKIADLQSLEGVLAQMVSECSGTEVPDCPIIDTLSINASTAGRSRWGVKNMRFEPYGS